MLQSACVTPASASRLQTLDAVRGFAVMGILLLNIVDFGLPSYAYVDPHFYGGASGANWWAWAIAYVFADGKMRGLFTMLFGASTVLIAERAAASGERPARVHYARMAVLLVIGLIHAYLIWSGDILVLYALCGALVFVAWRWPPRLLLYAAGVLLAWRLASGVLDYATTHAAFARALAPGASAADLQLWRDWVAAATPSRDLIPAELAGYRGGWLDALHVRVGQTWFLETIVFRNMLSDTFGLMLLGMALFRMGFFSGSWSRTSYRRVALAGFAITVPLYWPLALWIERQRFSPMALMLSDALHLALLRPLQSLAWAALVILLVQSGRAARLSARLAAAGRMAFSNYLGTSILCTLFFNGYGLGWFGYLERWQLYLIVPAVWALILAWSAPWLARFRYGPFEWLWRSAARGALQPLRR